MNDLSRVKRVCIIGSGTMGSGIAQLFAVAGYQTLLYDLDAKALATAEKTIDVNLNKGIEKGKLTESDKNKALKKLKFSTSFDELTGDFFVEAIVEKLEAKQELFQRLAAQNTANAILATNTSSIPVTRIARAVDHPERVVGMHFFNPAHIMKLVEVIAGAATEQTVVELTSAMAHKLGKVAVVAKDSPGFIVNRVARHFYVESLKLAEEKVADYKTIDRLLESAGFRMGPFSLMDLIGVDTNFSVTSSMYESFHYDSKFRPSRMQEQKVDAGHHGRKSGIGFYKYSV